MEKLRGQKWYKFVSVIYVLALPKRAYQQVGVRRNVSSIPIRETSAKTSAVKPIFQGSAVHSRSAPTQYFRIITFSSFTHHQAMTLEEYRQRFGAEDAVGWQCIDAQLAMVYGDRAPRHYAAPLHYIAGGLDPLDGTSYYDRPNDPPHIHVVSYGLSELYYNEASAGEEFSKTGFELTCRIKRNEDDTVGPTWVSVVMNNLARYVHKSGRWFEVNQFVPAGGPLCTDMDTDITGLVFALDPELGRIDTPHGEVNFLQMVGITTAELQKLQADPSPEAVQTLIEELRAHDPLLVTDMERR